MSQPDTKQRLLDVAERLFAAEGFHNTSLRTITGEAEANLAAVNYHFGSKEALLEAVFCRRLLPLNDIRRERLEKVRAAARQVGERPKVGDVLRAFIEPTLQFRESGPGAEAFLRLVGRALAEPDDTIRKIFIRLVEPLFFFFYEILTEALPGLPRDSLFWRLHFVLGALSHTMCMAGHMQVLPPGIQPPTDAGSLTLLLLDFLIPGMEAPCD
ncbi:MAG: TetR family transcriptional regulator [Syntrophotaleaceae bacterium]